MYFTARHFVGVDMVSWPDYEALPDIGGSHYNDMFVSSDNEVVRLDVDRDDLLTAMRKVVEACEGT